MKEELYRYYCDGILYTRCLVSSVSFSIPTYVFMLDIVVGGSLKGRNHILIYYGLYSC